MKYKVQRLTRRIKLDEWRTLADSHDTKDEALTAQSEYEEWLSKQPDDVQKTVKSTRVVSVSTMIIPETERSFAPTLRNNAGTLGI